MREPREVILQLCIPACIVACDPEPMPLVRRRRFAALISSQSTVDRVSRVVSGSNRYIMFMDVDYRDTTRPQLRPCCLSTAHLVNTVRKRYALSEKECSCHVCNMGLRNYIE